MAEIVNSWISQSAINEIYSVFGQDGGLVVNAANAYVNGISLVNRSKAIALANIIDIDPMFVCSLSLNPQGLSNDMPKRAINIALNSEIDTGLVSDDKTILKADKVVFASYNGNRQFGSSDFGDQNDWRAFNYNGVFYWDCGSSRLMGSGVSLNTEYSIEVGNNYYIVSGYRKTGTTQSASSIAANVVYLANGINLNDGVNVYDGTDWHRIVPSLQNNVVGVVDLYNMSFHAAVGTGTSTIPNIIY